jgi:hypothetical protein
MEAQQLEPEAAEVLLIVVDLLALLDLVVLEPVVLAEQMAGLVEMLTPILVQVVVALVAEHQMLALLALVAPAS